MKKLIKSLFTVAMVFGLTVTLAACGGGGTNYKGTYKWAFNFPEFEMLGFMTTEEGVPEIRLNDADNTIETLFGGVTDGSGTYTYNEATKEIVCTFVEGTASYEMSGTLDEGVLTLNVIGFEIGAEEDDGLGTISESEEENGFSMSFDLVMVFEYDDGEGSYICTSAKVLEFEIITLTVELKKNNQGTLTVAVPMLGLSFDQEITYSVNDKKVSITIPGIGSETESETGLVLNFNVVDKNLSLDISEEQAEIIADMIDTLEAELGQEIDESTFDFTLVKQAS